MRRRWAEGERKDDSHPFLCFVCIVLTPGTTRKGLVSLVLTPDLEGVTEKHSVKILENNQTTIFNIWDTPGGCEYKCLRSLVYYGVDVIILCFSLSESKSWAAEIPYWKEELKANCPSIPIFFAVSNFPERKYGEDKIKSAAKAVGACDWGSWEGSNKLGIHALFHKVIKIARQSRIKSEEKAPKKECLMI